MPFRFLTILAMASSALSTFAANSAWRPAQAPLMTRWASEVDPAGALPEYPRPQMVRAEWQNLNGLWDYALTAKEDVHPPTQYAGKILVPFPLQSALSGVMQHFDEKKRLWYCRTFEIPPGWKSQRVLLHFGAVNWEAEVSLNGKMLGQHRGDYDAFSFDITDALKPGGTQELEVSVTDPIDSGTQPYGKQERIPHDVSYTAASGIWQTVWLEPVPDTSIRDLRITPDVDRGSVRITISGHGIRSDDRISISVLDGEREVSHALQSATGEISVPVPNAQLWSPEHPFLYNLKISLRRGDAEVDSVTSYFGMRKIAMAKDAHGVPRLFLNGKQIFMHGPLDQGYWPDGVYTTPTDEALRFDIEMTKKYGFNCTRKHAKVEPDRWYYWCDRLGLLVWQDMPRGNVGNSSTPIADSPVSAEAAVQFETELKAMIDGRWNHPSIVIWVLFNEGWGQYDTVRLTSWIKQYDPTRVVDSVTGYDDYGVGDLHDRHVYPGPGAPKPDGIRAGVNGESGSLFAQVEGHHWPGTPDRGKDRVLADDYANFVPKIWPLIDSAGLCAEIFTQLTDVEIENNGLMTYDRLPKADVDAIAKVNQRPAAHSPK